MSGRNASGWRGMAQSAMVAAMVVCGLCGALPAVAFDTGLATSPAPANQSATAVDLPTCLLGEWRHAHEDDTAGLRVYRPADYPFPPSRGRTGFAFLADDQLVSYAIAPADGILELPGRWVFTPPNLVKIALDNALTPPQTLVVASCSDDMMTVATP